MSTKKDTRTARRGTATKGSTGLSAEEKAAMKARMRELKAAEDGETALRSALDAMSPEDRVIGERIDALVRESAPDLVPKTWYGMPAYAKDGKVVVFFRSAEKFKERYAMLGFNDSANLDQGSMWPIAFAIKELSPADESKIRTLVKKAVS